jgi:hypothetical protein
MADYRLSYLKTLLGAAAGGLGVQALAHFVAPDERGIVGALIAAFAFGVALSAAFVAMGAILAFYRNLRRSRGKRDLFDASNASRSEQILTTAGHQVGILIRQTWRRLLGGRWLLVGDVVEIRALDEIQKTLDASGCRDGLPFMPEMAGFCGQRALVFRCVDKIYDYGRSKTLRRLTDSVLLAGLRCDGGAHGGCQASCYLLWKKAWLKPVTRGRLARGFVADTAHPTYRGGTPSTSPYRCQYTQLAAATTPMASWDVRQDVRPLFAGNVTVGAFCIAMLTRLFNKTQAARGGAGYPGWSFKTEASARSVERGLTPGDTVRVLPIEAIAATLNEKGRHRGLWFDRDMIRHCGQRYAVLRRVERIIDDATGEMLEMATPCVVLAGAEATGEFLRFCAQHEYPFWREVWLSREAPVTPG